MFSTNKVNEELTKINNKYFIDDKRVNSRTRGVIDIPKPRDRVNSQSSIESFEES